MAEDTMTGPLDIDIDLSQTKTATPTIKDGELVRWRLHKVRVDTGDKGKTIVLEWELIAPAPGSDGDLIKPGDFGSKFFDNIQLYAKADAKDPRWFEKKIATRLDALLGTGDPNNKDGKPVRPKFNAATIEQLIGKEIVAKMKVKTGDYVGNEFQTVYFPGDIQGS